MASMTLSPVLTQKDVNYGVDGDLGIINSKTSGKNAVTTEVVATTQASPKFPHVLYVPQYLSKEQQAQVRENIGVKDGISSTNQTDWSFERSIKLPMPKFCTKVNIISNAGLSNAKNEIKTGAIEFWDKTGNYFKKYIKFKAQGTSSILYIEKNQTIDIYNDPECSDPCDIIFGNWVAQDSFHLKAYYIDVFRGISNAVYNLCEEVIKYMDSRNNRVVYDESSIKYNKSTGNFATDFGDGALCHPDGFPVELYVNGDYYGLYVWNLKKHRKNYSMDKSNYTTALLDGVINSSSFFGGSIDWTAFELKNPKKLVTMDGTVYDADTNRKELIDSSSAYYDASNQTHKDTAKIKELIIRQAQAMNVIKTSQSTLDFLNYYDYKAMACYFIVSNVICNYDGFNKNWIWTIYNNTAAPSFYDLDSVFGRVWDGTYVESGSIFAVLGTDENLPTGQLFKLFKSELKQLYKDLRSSGILTVDNIMKHVNAWINFVGLDAYNRNNEKWTSIPSYRSMKTVDDGTNEGGFYDSPKRIKIWLEAKLSQLDENFFI